MNAGVKLIAAGFAAVVACAAPTIAAPADGGPASIAALQARLVGLGYDPGPLDGVMSAKTQQAMSAYQRATGRPIAAGPTGNPIVTAQMALQRLGFLSEPADGAIGPQTRDAIIRFQAAQHLPIDPRVSDRLLAALAQPETPPTPAAPPGEPEVTGRQPLPPGVTPPPIR